MNTYNEEKQPSKTSKWQSILLALTSAILGISAHWLTWFWYGGIANRLDISLYNWIQLASIALMGSLCLAAAILFIIGRPSGRSVFKAGVSIVPLLLFSNLVVLLFRVIQNLIQGNGISLLSRLYASPLNKAILGVVLVLILLSVLKEAKKS